ncbi:hypothetical protein QQM39_39840 [Streptomyces sp. DT2A-34]|uniref:hypothetical protein n=1 Tax=Streptomyces sp. DT2A-34 TaxID=3051182 RepID=UPI00265B9532|nr:hypothetical protein [Streptomyces sp. DT2A-34]MDO0916749.1 hypothetical protein [Streptomyces sp. DT2A-34]
MAVGEDGDLPQGGGQVRAMAALSGSVRVTVLRSVVAIRSHSSAWPASAAVGV